MNRPNFFQVLPLALGFVSSVCSPAWAQAADGVSNDAKPVPFSGHRHGGGAGRGGKEFETIKSILTPDQTTKFDSIMAQSMSTGKPIRQQLLQLQSTSGDNPDAKTQSKIDDLKAQMKENHKATHEKIMALLTPDQKAKLAALKTERQQSKQQAAAPKVQAGGPQPDADDGAMSGGGDK